MNQDQTITPEVLDLAIANQAMEIEAELVKLKCGVITKAQQGVLLATVEARAEIMRSGFIPLAWGGEADPE